MRGITTVGTSLGMRLFWDMTKWSLNRSLINCVVVSWDMTKWSLALNRSVN